MDSVICEKEIAFFDCVTFSYSRISADSSFYGIVVAQPTSDRQWSVKLGNVVCPFGLGETMKDSAAEYLLLTETYPEPGENIGGQWRFLLQKEDGTNRLEVSDSEPGISGERLQLLAVIRGLEAIDGRANVTLVTSSRYVGHGIRFGLEQWREKNWQWERFGEMTMIKNVDLWLRVDRALKFHTVECRVWRLNSMPRLAKTNDVFMAERPKGAKRQRFSRLRELPGALLRGVGKLAALPRHGLVANL